VGFRYHRGTIFGIINQSEFDVLLSDAVMKDRYPQRIGSLLSQLMSRRGYAQVFASDALQAALESEVGPALAPSVRAGKVRAGVLQIFAGDSVTLQELSFRKRAILKRLQQDLPNNKINDIRFRVQKL